VKIGRSPRPVVVTTVEGVEVGRWWFVVEMTESPAPRARKIVGWTLVYCVLLAILIAQSAVRSVGDGREYLMYGLSLARGEGPAMTADAIDRMGAELARDEPGLRVRPFDPWAIARSGPTPGTHSRP
jgi:hypothetical protein